VRAGDCLLSRFLDLRPLDRIGAFAPRNATWSEFNPAHCLAGTVPEQRSADGATRSAGGSRRVGARPAEAGYSNARTTRPMPSHSDKFIAITAGTAT
jgi:hypothetical protein